MLFIGMAWTNHVRLFHSPQGQVSGQAQQRQPAEETKTAVEWAAQTCAEANETSDSDPGKREKRELCAQFRAAAAAERSAISADSQFVLSVIGLFAILTTLWVTGRAAYHASVQAAAAVDGNKNTLLIGQNQSRAYLSVRALQAPVQGDAAFQFRIVNSGQTPARAITFESAVLFYRGPERRAADFNRTTADPAARLQIDLPGQGADQIVVIGHADNPNLRPWFANVSERRPATFICVVRYQDVFQRCFELVHRTDIGGPPAPEGGPNALLNVVHVETVEREIEQAEFDRPINLDPHMTIPGTAIRLNQD